MGVHVTQYKTENGKTRKAKGSTAKAADKNAADNKNQPAAPAKQGASQ